MEKKKVIYIDDESVNLKLFEMNFSSYYDLTICEYPEEALEKIKNENIEIVITDYKMPTMNGMELIEEVKKVNEEAKCMILTGFLENELLLDQSKIYKFITKPYGRKEVIINHINSAISDLAV